VLSVPDTEIVVYLLSDPAVKRIEVKGKWEKPLPVVPVCTRIAVSGRESIKTTHGSRKSETMKFLFRTPGDSEVSRGKPVPVNRK
jgi:hypothetical protein